MCADLDKKKLFLKFFGALILFLAGGFILYSILFPIYSSLVLSLSKGLLLASNEHLVKVLVKPHESVAAFLFQESPEIYISPYNVYYSYMNLVFGTALIAATPGETIRGKVGKCLTAVGVLFVIHIFQSFFDLAYVSTLTGAAPQSVPYGEAFRTFLREAERFNGHMGLILPPFLLWFGLCHNSVLGIAKSSPKKGKFSGIGRNDLCPCGSGRKYKACCGR